MPDSPTPYCLLSDGGGHCGLHGEDGDYLTATSTFSPALGGMEDSLTGLVWVPATGAINKATYLEAEGACTTEETFLDGGQITFSLPTAIELMTLLDLGAVDAGDLVVSPLSGLIGPKPYWASSTTASGSPSTVQLDFGAGQYQFQPDSDPTATAGVVCVAPTRPTRLPEYGPGDAGLASVSSGTIDEDFVDAHTGLEWVVLELNANLDDQLPWASGLSVCNNLNQQVCSDWRLPSYKELATLVDFTSSAGIYDNGLLSQWTSSAYAQQAASVLTYASVQNQEVSGDQVIDSSLNTSYLYCVRNDPAQ